MTRQWVMHELWMRDKEGREALARASRYPMTDEELEIFRVVNRSVTFETRVRPMTPREAYDAAVRDAGPRPHDVDALVEAGLFAVPEPASVPQGADTPKEA